MRRLRDAGWDVRLLCHGKRWDDDLGLGDARLDPHVEVASADGRDLSPRSLLRRPAALARLLAAGGPARDFHQPLMRLRPDLIHFHSGSAACRGMELKQPLGCRVVVSFREDGEDLGTTDLGPVWREADLLLFPDAGLLERAVAIGCPRERAVVVSAAPVVPGAGSDGQRPSATPLRLLSGGPLTWEQGLEHSVHGVRLALDMGVACEYRVLGRGPHGLAVAFARHQYGLEETVRLVPKAPLDDEIRTADVLVDPAVTETTSAAPPLTAQAAGVPFVATHRAGLCGDAGIVVPRRDPRAIADALAALARDPPLRAEMGRVGRSRANGSVSFDEHVGRLQDAYARALGG
jgi:glycosyltransferase involved in cell wall biosynthesis